MEHRGIAGHTSFDQLDIHDVRIVDPSLWSGTWNVVDLDHERRTGIAVGVCSSREHRTRTRLSVPRERLGHLLEFCSGVVQQVTQFEKGRIDGDDVVDELVARELELGNRIGQGSDVGVNPFDLRLGGLQDRAEHLLLLKGAAVVFEGAELAGEG